MTPPVVCVIGKKKSGKTTTVVGLVRALRARGHDVMTLKHGHGFALDHEGRDSWRHRNEGGASRVVLAGPEGVAMVGDWGNGREATLEELVQRFMGDAGVVVAEGFKSSGYPRFEVFRRAAAHATPWYGSEGAGGGPFVAILTDVPGFRADVPVLALDDPNRFELMADLVERSVPGHPAAGRTP